jgi:TatD DNase family protein
MKEFKYIDTHAHVNFAAYDEDREEVIKRAADAGVAIVNVGTQYDMAKLAVELARQYDNCYAIIGLHPIHTDKSYHDEQELGAGNKEFASRGEVFDLEAYRELAVSGDVVGIGECGLDYYRTTPDSLEKQREAFHAQIQLALELDLPLMLHIRANEGSMDAYHDAIEILSEYKKEHGDTLRGNAHFFAGDTEVAQKFLDLGFDMSFTGVITFVSDYEELVKFMPIDRMHAETDCPYVTPAPYRGKRNEPSFVIEVVKKIAEIKGLSEEEASEQLIKNSKRLYGI